MTKPASNMIDQFNKFVELKRKAKENAPKGPVDIKALRAKMADMNKKNREPA